MKNGFLIGLIAAALGGAQVVQAQVVDRDGPDLEAKVKELPVRPQQGRVDASLQQKVLGLAKFREATAGRVSTCVEVRRSIFAGKYAVAFDANQHVCRIYDLSFPTLLGSSSQKISSLPVENLSARDYLNWINGRYEDVYQRMTKMRVEHDSRRSLQAGWVGDLKFRQTPDGVKAQEMRGQGNLPAVFAASDLEIGTFKFSMAEKSQLNRLFAEARQLSGADFAKATSEDLAWQALVERPEAFLEKIKFNWDDARKVYDIMLEGEFLPLRGPVALVDYERPYKQAVESLIRGLMGTLLRNLVTAIPQPTVRAVVDVAVTDVLEFVNLMYDYQGNQFEEASRAALSGRIPSVLSSEGLEKGLNIYFGGRSNLLSEYILAMAQGKPFSWEEIDKIGSVSRYRVEKAREIQLRNANSRLVLKKGCEVSRPFPYFGVCTKDGKRDAMYSLMSEQTVLFWNLGAPMIHRFDRPSEVLLKRATSWLLSVAARVFGAPYLSRGMSDRLSNELKGFATAGLSDEGFLKEQLALQKKREGTLSTDNENLMRWLYIQNINPFLSKSAEAEDGLVQRNASALEAH